MHDDNEDLSRADADFARQLSAPLRVAEPLSADFDARVMAAVRREHVASLSRPPLTMWRRPRTVAMPAPMWVAIAAGFAGIVSLATLSVARMSRDHGSSATLAHEETPTRQPPVRLASTTPAPATDTVYLVRFVLVDARAHTVSLLGDFNAWAKHATPLTVAAKPGVWSAQVALAPGRHEYAFLVDGKRWVADPAAEHHVDDFGTQSSVVAVGTAGITE
ncbi:MAG TPA: isoamylase early set domain-containing protein [Candidatus Elarobacter sp.]|nr:isoamylase early set domain-containing protein [Candidatus Elarobacter sp.]